MDELRRIFMQVAYGLSLVIQWRRCDKLCTSGFVDDVIFSYHETNGPDSSTALWLEGVCQVPVPVGRHTISVWLNSSEDKVSYLRMNCFLTELLTYLVKSIFINEGRVWILHVCSCDNFTGDVRLPNHRQRQAPVFFRYHAYYWSVQAIEHAFRAHFTPTAIGTMMLIFM